ncbi:hypothetical protein CPB84DRAFT_1687000 [Gymnopilus junonius]|uniref:Uncharacterized protein n=1 Tax=Gymnopilus junonius TaxID=109634 RepID=A0A9P5NG65_GYMJU|nr:hypothetical protein CPB84DRAFT_1687000 [Gymnopilus junonius]
MWDITRLFKQWACTKAKGEYAPDSFAFLCEQCSKLINGSLKTTSRLETIAMNYQNYDCQIVQRLGVKLIGWTYHSMVSPFNIHTVDNLRILWDALVCRACFWMRLSKGEMTHHMAALEEHEAAGEIMRKKRKEQSDKGMPKGPRKKVSSQEDDNDDDEESNELEAGPSKKRKVETHKKGKRKSAVSHKVNPTKAKAQVPPSREFIEDSDLKG